MNNLDAEDRKEKWFRIQAALIGLSVFYSVLMIVVWLLFVVREL